MSHRVFRRLRLTLAAWYAGVFAVMLVLLGVLAYAYLASEVTEDVDDLNSRAAHDVRQGLGLDAGLHEVSPAAFALEMNEAHSVFNAALVQLVDAEGRVRYASAGALGTAYAAGPTCETIRAGGHDLRLYRLAIGPAGHPSGTLVVGHDMRDRLQSLENLARGLWLVLPIGMLLTLAAGTWLAGKALRPIQENFEQQRRFIADASHELRTPVTIIAAQAEAGLGGDAAQAHAAHKAILRTAERMKHLVGGLLLLSRSDASALTLDRRTFALDDLVEETVEDLRALAEARGLALRFERRGDHHVVTADAERLQQVVVALVDNALKFTPEGGTVDVAVGGDGATAWLSVADTGPGIPPEALPHVFERFYRVSHSGTPGAGLGLAIVQAIAEAHGGHVRLDSRAGAGTAVRVSLPTV